MLYITGQNTCLLEALNKFGVEHLVIGGLAVSFYCPQREVDDLDLLINPTLENAKKVEAALVSLGIASSEYIKLTKPKIQIQLKTLHYADIVTPEEDFDFKSLYSNSIMVEANEVPVCLPSIDDLIRLKSTDREKDLRDVALLRNKVDQHK